MSCLDLVDFRWIYFLVASFRFVLFQLPSLRCFYFLAIKKWITLFVPVNLILHPASRGGTVFAGFLPVTANMFFLFMKAIHYVHISCFYKEFGSRVISSLATPRNFLFSIYSVGQHDFWILDLKKLLLSSGKVRHQVYTELHICSSNPLT